MNKNYLFYGILILALATAGYLFSLQGGSKPQNKQFTELQDKKFTVYKSPDCGCCGLYVGYLERHGISVNVIDTNDIESIKKDQQVPKKLWSCHTTLIDDYFVEGHIPLEGIDKLMTEKPEIAGIGLPGMPSGSPGMPGVKHEPFKVSAVSHDQEITEYVEL